MENWISVRKKMPGSRDVLIWGMVLNGDGTYDIHLASFYDDEQLFRLSDYSKIIIVGVTHWMPLPEPPKKNENNI